MKTVEDVVKAMGAGAVLTKNAGGFNHASNPLTPDGYGASVHESVTSGEVVTETTHHIPVATFKKMIEAGLLAEVNTVKKTIKLEMSEGFSPEMTITTYRLAEPGTDTEQT